MEADDPELQKWLEMGGNYGVICGDGMIEIDTDNKEMSDKLAEFKTLKIKTGKPDGIHNYFRSSLEENGTLYAIDKDGNFLLDEKGRMINVGNIKADRQYVVGPGSNHFSGRKYYVLEDNQLVGIKRRQIEEIFGKSLVWANKKIKENEGEAKEEGTLVDKKLPIEKIIKNFEDLRKTGEKTYQGSHPVHGSETGNNFSVDLDKNAWYCFRCNSGGGPLMWLVVEHGDIRCDEARKGILRGDLFKKALKYAEEAGYKVELKKADSIEPDVSKYFEGEEKKTFRAAFLARELMNEFQYFTRRADKTIFVYTPERGIYEPVGEDQIVEQCIKKLGKYTSILRQREVVNFIAGSTIKELDDPDPYMTALKNGVYDLNTRTMKPFSPDYFITNALPITYDPNAKCPTFDRFIPEILGKEDITVIQELFGYFLIHHYHIHKIFLFIGVGRNGKTTLLTVMYEFLGKDNYSAIWLQDLLNQNSRFLKAELSGKIANLADDLPNEALKNTGGLKMLSGESPLQGEIKYKSPFKFVNSAKLVCACNEVPPTPDDTDAFFARFVLVFFPNQFLEDNPKTDIHLSEKLTTPEELSGIFNWAIEGADRLMKNGKFSYSKSVEDVRTQYSRLSNPIKAFSEDCIEDDDGEEDRDVIFQAFVYYCREHKIPVVSKIAFSQHFQENVPSAVASFRFDNYQRIPTWKNIKLKKQLDTSPVALDLTKKQKSVHREVESSKTVSVPRERSRATTLETNPDSGGEQYAT